MRLSLLLLLGVVSVAACGSVKEQPDANVPDDAAIDAPRACAVGVTAMCANDDLVSCDGQGNITGMQACALGCNASVNRCTNVDPSNGLATHLDDAATAPDLVLQGATVIDTDGGTITDQSGARVLPTATITNGVPVEILVIKVKSLTTGGDVSVTGSRALAIVSSGAVTIGHLISVSASRTLHGPGALPNDPACRGGSAAAGNSEGKAGGGGGGFGTAGGRGGTGGSPTITGGNPGGPAGTPELSPLRGGCVGGRASNAGVNYAGGGGGGAVQIVSNTSITLSANGVLSANGGGAVGPIGPLFCLIDSPCGNGEGGGSGGAILLEAPSVVLDTLSGIYANGGGATCSTSGSAANGTNTTTPAPGQTCTGQTGSGGAGAAGATNALAGSNKVGLDAVGGGGGGGHGRIRINLPVGVTFSPAGTISGASTVGALGTR